MRKGYGNPKAKLPHLKKRRPAQSPGSKVRARIAFLERTRANLRAYQQDCVDDLNHHGAWDAAVNISEAECEIAGLRFALSAFGF